MLLACLLFSLGTADSATWTGLESNQWRVNGNWDPDTQFPDTQISGAPTEAVFGDFGTTALTVTQSARTDLAHLLVNADAQADLTINIGAHSLWSDVTISGASVGLNTVTLVANPLRISAAAVTYDVGAGKTLVTDYIYRNTGGNSRVMDFIGGGTVEYTQSQLGLASSANTPFANDVRVTSATWAITPGTGTEITKYVAENNPGRSGSIRINANGILAMDVGPNGDWFNVVLTGDSTVGTGNTGDPYQGNWLITEDGATLAINKTVGFQQNTWYTLFRNVNAPDFNFQLTGLDVGETADFRLFEYNSGFYDYQVMVIPEPTTASLLLGLSAIGLALRRRRLR